MGGSTSVAAEYFRGSRKASQVHLPARRAGHLLRAVATANPAIHAGIGS